MSFTLLPSAIKGMKKQEPTVPTVSVIEKEEVPKMTKKETEKKVKKVVAPKKREENHVLDELIENKPTRRQVYEYFEEKIEDLNRY